jgi:ribonucleoside-diphosphate reductase alpha chain
VELTPNALTVLERRYLAREDGRIVELPEDLFRRVAQNIADVDRIHYGKPAKAVKKLAGEFRAMMESLEFLPNSPTLMNAGRELQQLAACFVLPIEDSMNSIFDSLKYSALIHQSGGGTGFSFSRLRPKNDQVRSTGGVASGPVSFLKVYNAATEAVKQGGTRRGANMGILRVDHPDIREFITCKQDNNEITNFNISVGVTDAFVRAVEAGDKYDLINPRTGRAIARCDAREIFNLIVSMAWRNGEPGVIFLDSMNRDNPTPALAEIESTNPCGEQPLLPFEACNLGSLNLARMVATGPPAAGGATAAQARLDWDRLKELIWKAVHFLDNVIDASRYPLEIIDQTVKGNRKIGLGVMGFADLLIQLGIGYDTPQAAEVAGQVMEFIRREAWAASAQLAEERGAFPNFAGSILAGGRSVRNATTTTIAPTGTISIIAGCSSGIEPLFALAFVRNVLDNDRLVEVNPLFERVARERGFYSPEVMAAVAARGTCRGVDGVPEDVQRTFATAHDVSGPAHIGIQAAFQRYTDNAVSKTVNLPHDATEDDVAAIYWLAYRSGCKGVTIYRDGSREGQVLSIPAHGRAEGAAPAPICETVVQPDAAAGEVAAAVDSVSAGRGHAQVAQVRLRPRPRPEETPGITRKYRIGGCGKLFVTVNSDDEGICEVFINTGEEGCSPFSEALGRMISVSLRAGMDPQEVIEQVRGIKCVGCIVDPETKVLSCPDAIGKALEKHLQGYNRFEPGNYGRPKGLIICPEKDCGGLMVHEGGCYHCLRCGYSRCA